MTYSRKTRDEYDIEQRTTEGWEIVNSEATRRDAQRSAREYRENQPEFAVRIVKRRVRVQAPETTKAPETDALAT